MESFQIIERVTFFKFSNGNIGVEVTYDDMEKEVIFQYSEYMCEVINPDNIIGMTKEDAIGYLENGRWDPRNVVIEEFKKEKQ